MVKKFGIIVLTMLSSIVALAQKSDADSTYTIIDGIKVPLVERRYVANTYFQDNWYVGAYAGGVYNWGSDCSKAGFFKKIGPAFALNVGKQLTPVSDLRLVVGYTRNTGVTDDQFTGFGHPELNHKTFKFNAYSLGVDYMMNFTNLICGFRENRFLNIYGIIGLGGSMSRDYETDAYSQFYDNSHAAQLGNKDKYHNRQHSLVNIRAGVGATFNLSHKWDLHVEAVNHFIDNSYDGNPTTGNIWDGRVDVLAGVTYHFKNRGGKDAGFYYPRHDMELYNRKLAAINDLREKTRLRKKEVEEMEPDTVAVNAHVTYTLIAFDGGSTTVDRLQQTNIYTTALAWTKAPQSKIYITNSIAVDNKLYRGRAEAIRDILVERYEIPASKINIVANEKTIHPKGDYIVFIVNE